ncbi:competence type IV pilus assembly protein ComGB [Gottfriedia sp. NPDC057948]|uniref:competence type IV pilus assembly protein ComGB n=1 Tax=Gottfriedia sp. NPDC057948 TaxID=3346287 RepID=UPI0036DA1421
MVKFFNKRKLTYIEQAKLLKILGELLQKGYPLIQAIEFLTIQFPDDLKELIYKAKIALVEGGTFIDFAKMLGLHQDVLVYLYYAEKHGDLSLALGEGSYMLTKKIQHRAYIRKIMGYPIFLITILLLILFLFRNIIIPQYEMLFSTFHSNQNSFIFIYLQVIKKLPSIMFSSLFLIGLTVYGYLFAINKLNSIERMDKLIQIPLVRKYLITMNTYEFSMQLSILLHAGFPIVDALKTMQNNDSRAFIKEKAVVFYNQILNGISMQEAFKNERAFHRDIIFVIEHGMNNSTLSKELADYADYLKESIEAYFHRSIRIIQPIILILISTSILSLYIAILFPMFQLMNNI